MIVEEKEKGGEEEKNARLIRINSGIQGPPTRSRPTSQDPIFVM